MPSKVRRLYGGQVVIGFAGAVADAFTLSEKFEEKLTQCGGNLERAAVAAGADAGAAIPAMRGSSDSQMIVADKGHAAGPQRQRARSSTRTRAWSAIGSGGNYALAAARALVQNTDLSAHDIAEKALHIAASHLRLSPTTT